MGRKGNLAIFEGSDISETGEVTPTKIGVYACDINPYLHEFFGPWSEGEIWPFFKVAVSPKPERPHPPELVHMHLTSTSTCMNFLSRF